MTNSAKSTGRRGGAKDGGTAERREQLEAASEQSPPEHDTLEQVEREKLAGGVTAVGPPVVTPDQHDGDLPTAAPPTTGIDSSLIPSTPADVDAVAGEGRWELFNATNAPVVYDDDGHLVGGGERVQVDKIAGPAQRAIDANRLLKRKAPKTDD